MRTLPVLVASAPVFVASIALAQTSGTYTNDFTAPSGSYFGAATNTTFNNHSDLQLTTDYPSNSDAYFGTWTSGSIGNEGAITSFTATFQVSFNNNNNGSWRADGFSFLFGNCDNDITGAGDWGHSYLDNWKGGEWGFNNFSRQQAGMSVGFDYYGGDAGVQARWGINQVAGSALGENWGDPEIYYGYDYALYDENQATYKVEWTTGGDMVVSIRHPLGGVQGNPGNDYIEVLRTNAYANIDTTDFTFGFAGRVGGATWDVLIDNLQIDYTAVPAPSGALALMLAPLFRRRRR